MKSLLSIPLTKSMLTILTSQKLLTSGYYTTNLAQHPFSNHTWSYYIASVAPKKKLHYTYSDALKERNNKININRSIKRNQFLHNHSTTHCNFRTSWTPLLSSRSGQRLYYQTICVNSSKHVANC